MPTSDAMYVRPMTRADLPAVARIAAAAFADDPLFAFLYPYRHTHPQDFERDFLFRFRSYFVDQGVWGIVCAEPSPSPSPSSSRAGSQDVVVGSAFWRRAAPPDTPHASLPASAARNRSPLHALERQLLGASGAYRAALRLGRASEPANMSRFFAEAAASNPCAPLARAGYWRLVDLTVDPGRQRRGAGALLVRWGVGAAAREGVAAVVISSAAGRGLYAREGAAVVDCCRIAALPPDPFMVWDPERRWTRGLREGEERVLHGVRCEAAWREQEGTSL